MDYEAFYNYCESKGLADNRRDFDAFCKKVDEVFLSPDFDKIDLACELFTGNGSLSKSQFYRKRPYVIAFYEWLCSKKLIGIETLERVKSLTLQEIADTDSVQSFYFGDIQSMINYIDLVGAQYGCGKKYDLLNIKTICILAWNGLSRDEMCLIKISDINGRNNSISVGEKDINLEKDLFEYIQAYSTSTEISALPSKKRIKLADTGYLLRSRIQDKLTPEIISAILTRFNELAILTGKTLQIQELKRNGIFQYMYEINDDKKAYDALMSNGIESKLALGYMSLYKVWKKRYKGGE